MEKQIENELIDLGAFATETRGSQKQNTDADFSQTKDPKSLLED